jgi:hypothetical protein
MRPDYESAAERLSRQAFLWMLFGGDAGMSETLVDFSRLGLTSTASITPT